MTTLTAPAGSGPTSTPSSRYLDACRAALGSDRAVADALGVSASQVSRWRRGQTPDPDNADRLGGLALVAEMLGRWIEPETVGAWLRGANVHLDNRTPLYLIRRGHVADVIGAIEAEKAGAYG